MKTKKLIFLMLILLVLSVVSVNAQVSIGSENPPHSGAVLDLQSDNQGLKLPNVALDDDLTVFGLPDTDPVTDAKGMYVYNTNSTIGEGVYVWDGYQWILVKASVGEKLVESISISATGASNSVKIHSGFLQLTANVLPVDASNPEIIWSIDRGSGNASVNQTGTVFGNRVGTVSVIATASNGVRASKAIFVLPQDMNPVLETINTHDYLTYNFNGDVWMIQNSKEGESTYQYFGGDESKANGYYYSFDQKNETDPKKTPCPGNWHLPTITEKNNLVNYLNFDAKGQIEAALFTIPEYIGGVMTDGGVEPTFMNYGTVWVAGNDVVWMDYGGTVRKNGSLTTSILPVRCVKNH